MTITYEIGDSLYLNITNRCPNACEFCVRDGRDSAHGSDNLWLEREPTVAEILEDIGRRDFSKYKEVVFCGFGEPLERLDDVLEVCRHLKQEHGCVIRINTNGLANRMHGRDTEPELAGLVDCISISLNASTAKGYNAICHSVFGLEAHPAILRYAEQVKEYVPTVIFTVVDTLPPDEIERCRTLAEEIGVNFRVRNYF